MKSGKLYKLLIAALVFIVAISLLHIDDPLSESAQAKLDAIPWQEPSDAYLYLMGLDASLGAEPIEAGKKALIETRRKEAAYEGDLEEFEYGQNEPRLELPDLDLFCSIQERECLNSLFSGADINLADEVYVTLKNRYLTLLKMRGLHSLTKPHIYENFPAYSLLVKANRLVSLDAIQQARSCCPEKAAEKLYALVELQKLHMLEADNLIAKMISYVLISETVDVLSLVLREHKIDGLKIKPLSKEQLSLATAMNREFAFARSILSVLTETEPWQWLPSWVERVALKRNITTNALVPLYDYYVLLSESNQHEFLSLIGTSVNVKPKSSWLRNPVGTYMNKISIPYMDMYVARGFDLNTKISLFNGVLGNKVTPELLAKIANPYYESGHSAAIIADGSRACFDGPMEDSKYFRCLGITKKAAEAE